MRRNLARGLWRWRKTGPLLWADGVGQADPGCAAVGGLDFPHTTRPLVVSEIYGA